MSSGLELKETSDLPSLEGLDDDAVVDAMVGWFQENFEDPAMETPYEGEYIYIWGGPYDASEELYDAFPDAGEDLIARAVDEIQADGTFDWAPAGRRVQPDDEPEDENDDDQPLEERLEALASQLDRIEQHIAYWRNLNPQIGHNGPPDEFRLEPDDADLIAAEASVAEVRAELAKPDRANNADVEVVNRAEGIFRKLAAKIWNWTKKGAGALGLGVLGGIGKVAGENFAQNPEAFWQVLNEAAINLSHWAIHLVTLA